jgi:Tol biopolymer transport system component
MSVPFYGLNRRYVVRIGLLVVLTLAFAAISLSPDASAAIPKVEASPSPATTPHPFAEETAWIAYQTYRTDTGIGLIHPDGSDEHLIASDVHDEQHLPDWSPDGTRLVFTVRGGETEPLYEYDLATDTTHQLFACEDPCLGDDNPVHSPDGTRILFTRAIAPFVHNVTQGAEVPSDCGLWIGELSSGEVTQITSNTEELRVAHPRYTPDGQWILFTSVTPETRSLWVIPAAGGEPIVLVPGGIYGHGTWQPTPAAT